MLPPREEKLSKEGQYRNYIFLKEKGCLRKKIWEARQSLAATSEPAIRVLRSTITLLFLPF